MQLHGEQARKTDWLFGTILIDDLLPKSYKVSVEKEGYIPWEKNLEVKKRGVTEVKNVILIPELLQAKNLTESVEGFWVSPDRSFILLEKSSPSKGTWLSRWDVQKNTESIVWGKLGAKVSSVSWRKDSNAILVQFKGKTGFTTLLYEQGKDMRELKFFGKEYRRVEFASSSGASILLEKPSPKGTSLILGDYSSQTLSAPFATNVLSFAQNTDAVFWIDTKGTLWEKETLSSSPPSPLSTSGAFPLEGKPLSLVPTSQGIFLQQGTTLMLLNKETKLFETVSGEAKEFALSPDEKKIAIGTGNEIKLFFLEEDQDQPRRSKGEIVSIASFSDPVSSLTWITSHYLLFTTEDALKATEIDTRDRVNIADLGISSSSPFFWNTAERTLLLLNEGTLSLSEKLF